MQTTMLHMSSGLGSLLCTCPFHYFPGLFCSPVLSDYFSYSGPKNREQAAFTLLNERRNLFADVNAMRSEVMVLSSTQTPNTVLVN